MRAQIAVPLLVGLLGAWVAPTALAHPGHTHGFSDRILRGLSEAGLTLDGSGLKAPLGDSSASVPPDVAAGATGDPPLRVYVVVVDGLLPTQVGLHTPMLNELKNSGTWYEQARSVLPAETLPNHAAMATGVVPERNGVVANQVYRGGAPKGEYQQYPDFLDADTITTRLERAYGGAVDTATILSKAYLYGLFQGEYAGAGDSLPQRQADFHWDPRTDPRYVPNPSDHALDVGTMETFLGWIRTHAESPRPQFAFVNLGDVDRSGHADEEGAAVAAADRAAHMEDDELSERFASPFQQAAITDADTQIRTLVTELKDTGAWDETVLIVLSDHGMDWGPQNQQISLEPDLTAAGYTRGTNGPGNGATDSDYVTVGGGSTELLYVHSEGDIPAMARIACAEEGVAAIATREPVAGLDATKCRQKRLGDLGLDHPYSPEIEVFLDPGWHSPNVQSSSGNPLPGNHGNGVTQHSTLLVTGGHPAVDAADSVPGPRVYQRGDVAVPGGPGVMSVAPTVAGLFGIGSPAGGYDAAPLTEAFQPGAVDLTGSDPVQAPPAGGNEDSGPSDEDGGEGAEPLLTAASHATTASLTSATYTLTVANRGGAPARDVILSNFVPANDTLVSTSREPLDPAACAVGAVGATCRWAIGDLAPGTSAKVEATHSFPAGAEGRNRVSAQLDGAAPAETDPSHSDPLIRRTLVLGEDAHVDRGAPANTNYGACGTLQVTDANATTAFLDEDTFIGGDDTRLPKYGKLWGAEVQATVGSLSASDAAPVAIGAHRISSHDWGEGTGNCDPGTVVDDSPAEFRPNILGVSVGTGLALQGANPSRAARTPGRPDALPASESTAIATAPAQAAGDVLHWDVTGAFDTARERNGFQGLELRLAETDADAAVEFHSSESSTAAVRPRLVEVRSPPARATCVDVDPETSTRGSDTEQRLRAYATDGSRVINPNGDDACTGEPVPGAPIGWEIDDDTPDAYISTLAGEPTDHEVGGSGDAAPNRGSTLAGPSGRTFIDVRLGEPYAEGRNAGTTRIAAIALRQFSGDVEYSQPSSDEGMCEPGSRPSQGVDYGLVGLDSCRGEANDEDDILTTWEPVAAPAP